MCFIENVENDSIISLRWLSPRETRMKLYHTRRVTRVCVCARVKELCLYHFSFSFSTIIFYCERERIEMFWEWAATEIAIKDCALNEWVEKKAIEFRRIRLIERTLRMTKSYSLFHFFFCLSFFSRGMIQNNFISSFVRTSVYWKRLFGLIIFGLVALWKKLRSHSRRWIHSLSISTWFD